MSGEDVSFTDIKIKIPERGCDQGCEWRHALEVCAEDFRRFEKVSSWELDSKRKGSTFEARWGQTNLCATGTTHDGGADGKVIIERLCLSLPYIETFNSKVIKACAEDFRRFEKVSSWELDSEWEGSIFRARWGQTNMCATGTARDGGGQMEKSS